MAAAVVTATPDATQSDDRSRVLAPRTIWILAHRYQPDLAGGVERRLHAMARAAIAEGHTVRVFATRAFGGAFDDQEHEGVPVRWFDWPDNVDSNGWGACRRFEEILTQLGGAPDVLWTPVPSATVAARRIFSGRVDVLFTPGETVPLRLSWRAGQFMRDLRRVGARRAASLWMRRRMMVEAVRCASIAVVASDMERAWCLDGAAADLNLAVRARGVEIERWSRGATVVRPLQDGVLRVLVAARLDRRKNIEQVIRAVASLQSRKIRLTIHGRGPDRGRLERLIDELGCNAVVELTDWAHDMAEAYARNDVFVMSSDFEPFGLTTFEALASGCVVVLRRPDPPPVIIGCAEWLVDCAACLTYDTYGHTHLAETLRELSEDPERVRQLSREAAQWKGLRPWTAVIDQYIDTHAHHGG